MLEQPREGNPPGQGALPPLRLRRAIEISGGALPFDEFMRIALYDPEIGYYTRERQRVGREGDFITSVSVGECFGMLLARHFAPLLREMEEKLPGGELVVAELGAESGDLAADLMTALAALLPADLFARLCYTAIEPFGAKREPLRQRLEALGVARARVVAGAGELSRGRGVLIANEVLDAMPVQRLQWSDGEWQECCVALVDGGLKEVTRPIEERSLAVRAAAWPDDLDDGFTVEFNPGLDSWFAGLAGAFAEVHACLIDYGLESSAEFFDPSRRGGTLRAYRGHGLIDNPLSAPGETDLTSHVDFERVARAAEGSGFEVVRLSDQHRFLTHASRDWLLAIESLGVAPDAATARLLRQFRSLSHPSAMGTAFKVLELRKGGC